MPTAAPPMVDVRDIIRLVGQNSFARGQRYSRSGLVLEVEWDADYGRLGGKVKGSYPSPYDCHIDLVPLPGGNYRLTTGVCSCPVMANCKHVAALLVESNTRNLSSRAPKASDLIPTPPPAEAAWKAALSVGPLSGDPGKPATPVGLQFELREETPRTNERWRGPIARAATSTGEPGAVYRLGVRPVIRSATGNWVRGNVTWNSLGYQTHRLALDPEHQRWFAQLHALYRATTRDVYTGQDADWVYLDEFHSPLLWQLLSEAERRGVALVGSAKATVVIGAGARVGLDVSLRESGLELASDVSIDGERVDAASAGAIADHGIYVADLAARRYSLAPVALSLDQRRFLGRTLVVPTGDVAEFMETYLPPLRRGIEVTATDATVILPAVVQPALVATVTFGKKQSLTVDWAWEGEPDPRITDTVRAIVEPQRAKLSGLDAADFSTSVLPRLEQTEGVRVVIVGVRPEYVELTDVPKLTLKTVETDNRDWFDLGVLVSIGGRDIPFTPLFTALSKGATRLLLVDNSYLSLKQPVFDELRRLIGQATELAEWETVPRISRYQAALWEEFEDLADETDQAVSWRAAVDGLRDIDSITPASLPVGLNATMRPYQVDGYTWLAFLYDHGLGGILADDMGLGKTIQSLALIAHARESTETRKPFLVVAPTSVVSNWVAEAARFTPGLDVRAITETRAKSREPLPDADVIVTSYALFRLDFASYQATDWAGLILDEAQFVKNHSSKAHACAVELAAPFKLAITGTPMENSLTDLWSLFAITAAGLFPSASRFTKDWVRPIERGEQPDLVQVLRRRIRPLMMRRTKELVATDLPAKQEQVIHVDLAPRHQALYDTFLQKERQKLLGLIEDLDRNRFIVFRSLTLLRMLSLDASLVDEKYAGLPSSKLDVLMDQLADVAAEGHRALIFSQFTSYLHLAAARLEAAGIAYAYLDGSTTKRSDVIDGFKNGDAPVFLISLKAGGFGLNLTEADYVFLLDPWWNPATESQAIDRTHRIGQARNVMVYRLVARGTIEEKVMALKERKAKLFTAVMDDDAVFSSALSANDIRELLA